MTRTDFLNLITKVFGHYGLKTVSQTDINKSAYVPNQSQKSILQNMGHDPMEREDFNIRELFTDNELHVSYYATLREGSGRSPEPRMGLADLISYMSNGDEILFTNDNANVFIFNLSKLNELPQDINVLEEGLLTSVDDSIVENIINASNASPEPEEKTIKVYPRNSAVRAAVKKRAAYSCEFPSCSYKAFVKIDGEKFVEVHHILPLSEGGFDRKENMASLCPVCHRKLHYDKNKDVLIQTLKEYIDTLS